MTGFPYTIPINNQQEAIANIESGRAIVNLVDPDYLNAQKVHFHRFYVHVSNVGQTNLTEGS